MRGKATVLLTALALAAVAAGCGGGDEAEPSGAAGSAQAIEVSATEFAFEPATIAVDAPGTYTFRVVNDGQVAHAFEIEGQGIEEETETIAPGGSAELTVELPSAGEYEIYCPVGNHREQGMVGTLQVG